MKRVICVLDSLNHSLFYVQSSKFQCFTENVEIVLTDKSGDLLLACPFLVQICCRLLIVMRCSLLYVATCCFRCMNPYRTMVA